MKPCTCHREKRTGQTSKQVPPPPLPEKKSHYEHGVATRGVIDYTEDVPARRGLSGLRPGDFSPRTDWSIPRLTDACSLALAGLKQLELRSVPPLRLPAECPPTLRPPLVQTLVGANVTRDGTSARSLRPSHVNVRRLILGCINADPGNQRLILKRLLRFTHFLSVKFQRYLSFALLSGLIDCSAC